MRGGVRRGVSTKDCEARLAAKAAGEPMYAAEAACMRGHVGNRYTQTGTCVMCAAERNKRQRDYNRAIRERIDRDAGLKD